MNEAVKQINELTSLEEKYSKMVAILRKPGKEVLEELTVEQADAIHMTLGIAGESGEVCDAVKKWTIQQRPIDMENVVEELGDLEFYLDGLRTTLGITREQTLVHNLNKLLVGKTPRYPKGTYSNEQAQLRADKQETK